MNDPKINIALRQLAEALPTGCGLAVVVVRPADGEGKRQCHICEHNLDDEARALGADCLQHPAMADSNRRAVN